MVIDGHIATSIRLWCPNKELGCPGFIERDVLLYLVEPHHLYVWGACGECGTSGNLTVDLMELLIQCPVATAVM